MQSRDFSEALNRLFTETKDDFIDISSGELHLLVGGYPGPNHSMPTCCSVMRSVMTERDEILAQPPKGNGASLLIRYYLPHSLERKRFPLHSTVIPYENASIPMQTEEVFASRAPNSLQEKERNMIGGNKIVLLSCVKLKREYGSRAEDLYISQLFQKSLAYSKSLRPDKMFILSAKYYLLELDDQIEPYEETLNNKSDWEIKRWAQEIIANLRIKTDLEKDEFIFLAGEKYRRHLMPHLHHVSIPLKGLPLGRQLQFLSAALRGGL